MADLPLLPLAIDLGDIIRLIFLFLFLGVGAIRLFTDAANAQKQRQKGPPPPPDPDEARDKRKRDPQESIRQEVEEFLRRSGQQRDDRPAPQRNRPPRIEVIAAEEEFAPQPTPRVAPEKPRVPPVAAPPLSAKEARKKKSRERQEIEPRFRREEFAQRATELGGVVSQTDERLEARLAQKFDSRLGNLADMRRIREAADQQRDNRDTAPPLAQELLKTLTTPAGMKQAIILREILDRPIERW